MHVTEDRHDDTVRPRLCVLASGSGGNCSVLDPGNGTLILIDLGLSPRRTEKELDALGLDPANVTDVVLTHLDHDHCNAGWGKRPIGGSGVRTAGATLHVHRRHMGRASRLAGGGWRMRKFDSALPFELDCGIGVRPALLPHDELGVAAFRMELGSEAERASLGFATDLGRVGPDLIEMLGGVDVLAIESNYCPRLQMRSGRPDYLKRRIMAGAGHLSNEECADAVRRIEPREHVVLLHLSQECNAPEVARHAHQGADYALTLSSQDEPTRWVEIGVVQRVLAPRTRVREPGPGTPPTLFPVT